jgi:hypothetical protein
LNEPASTYAIVDDELISKFLDPITPAAAPISPFAFTIDNTFLSFLIVVLFNVVNLAGAFLTLNTLPNELSKICNGCLYINDI